MNINKTYVIMGKSDEKKARLGKDEYRAGNFIFKTERWHVKIRDIGSVMTHRISTSTAVGQLLKMAVKVRNNGFLHGYAALMYNISCTVPDEEFFRQVQASCTGCIERHGELYGIKKDIADKEDAKILDEERKLHEAIENLKEIDE